MPDNKLRNARNQRRAPLASIDVRVKRRLLRATQHAVQVIAQPRFSLFAGPSHFSPLLLLPLLPSFFLLTFFSVLCALSVPLMLKFAFLPLASASRWP